MILLCLFEPFLAMFQERAVVTLEEQETGIERALNGCIANIINSKIEYEGR